MKCLFAEKAMSDIHRNSNTQHPLIIIFRHVMHVGIKIYEYLFYII